MYSYTTNTQNMKVDFTTHTIIVSKKFMNQASKVGTPEFDLMLRMYRELPTFSITMKATARSAYRPVQPTYSAMQEYIRSADPNPEAALDEFQQVRQTACTTKKGYSLVRRWFLEKYPAFGQHSINTCDVYYAA